MAAAMRQQTPPNGMHPHHSMPVHHANGMPNSVPPPQQQQGPPPPQQQQGPPQKATPQHLQQANEAVWISIGNLSELMGDLDGAIGAYERALQHNQYSIPAMNQISCILRTKENFPRAVEYLQAILKLDQNNGEVWGSLGHCFLMMEDLQQAYSAYQQALYHLKDPKEPKLWYGIGILYDRYGSLEHAEEAFSQVMRMEPNFEKANEIYFRLGIIYKQQQKFGPSLECFKYIVQDPPRPLTEEDIWFQIGHVHEQQKDYDSAKAAYRRVLERDPKHAKVLQQLGWLYHQENPAISSQERAIEYLEQSVSSDNTDAQSWYLLGRCYMSMQKYSKAYEAYQQAVYRDGRNPTFWCSIGVLYYQINQYRDALDAYSRAIRLNPYISEVWYDLGTLYESCNNQTTDALDAYQRAADLDPHNQHIKHRLNLLRNSQAQGIQTQHSAPAPQDIHPQQYQAAGVGGPPGPPGPQWGAPSGPAQPAGQRPPGPGEGWGQQMAAIDASQRPPVPYDQKPLQGGPPPPTQAPPRQPSPRHDPMRPYQSDQRGAPLPRRPSPPPNNAAPGSYPPLPQPNTSSAQGPSRIPNPNYTAASLNTPPTSHSGPMPPPGRGQSPPPEIRPIVGPPEVKHSPGSQANDYNRGSQGYSQQPSILQAPPTEALQAAEAAARGRDDRPSTGYKRGPDSEDEYNKGPNKKSSNGDARPREEPPYSRGSPKDRQPSPPRLQRRSSSETRREQANQNYHPSEAAHNPQPTAPAPAATAAEAQPAQPAPLSQPSSQPQSAAQPQTPQAPPPSTTPQQQLPPMERPQEGPARKMELDEDYNDAGEDDKRGPGTQAKASPGALTNGQAKTETTA